MKWYWWIAIAAAVIAIWWYSSIYIEQKEVEQVMQAPKNNNVKAFLATLRYAEGTAGVNGYNTLYGGALFTNLSDHPYLTGEWKGKVLSDAMCKGAGLGPVCKSTAAGAYQITSTTWKGIKAKLKLTDFSPASQDLAAIELIREKGALDDIEKGFFERAIPKVKKIWASLPGAGYNQPEKTLTALKTIYQQNGGTSIV